MKSGFSSKNPKRRHISEISVTELNEALESFASRYLRGAISLSAEERSAEVIEISLEHTAYMLRVLVESCERDKLLSVNISHSDGVYIWRVDFGGALPARVPMYRILAAAEQAGFTCREEGTTLILGVKMKRRQVLSIYAASRAEAERALTDIFLL